MFWHFIYDGIPSDYYDVIACWVDKSIDGVSSAGMQTEISTQFAKRGSSFNIVQQNYNEPIKFTVQLVNKDFTHMDTLKERELKKWLCKRGEYKWMQVCRDEFEDLFMLANFSNPNFIYYGGVCGLEFEVVTSAPYVFSPLIKKKFEITDSNKTANIYIETDEDDYIYPSMKITMKQAGTLNIKNSSEVAHRDFSLDNLVVGEIITIDSSLPDISSVTPAKTRTMESSVVMATSATETVRSITGYTYDVGFDGTNYIIHQSNRVCLISSLSSISDLNEAITINAPIRDSDKNAIVLGIYQDTINGGCLVTNNVELYKIKNGISTKVSCPVFSSPSYTSRIDTVNGLYFYSIGGNQGLYYSTNLSSWQKVYDRTTAGVTYFKGKYVAAGSYLGYSYDGINWTFGSEYLDIAIYNSSGNIFCTNGNVLVCGTRYKNIYYSNDGISWNIATINSSDTEDKSLFDTFVYYNGKFVTMRSRSIGGSSDEVTYIATSTDGKVWNETEVMRAYHSGKYLLVYKNKLFIITDNAIYSTTDAKTLTEEKWIYGYGTTNTMEAKVLNDTLLVGTFDYLHVVGLEEAIEETSITLNTSSITLTEGDTRQLTATVTPSGTTVTWTSGNTAIATVSTSGLVTAISEGTARIYAEANGVTALCTVTVNAKAPTIIEVTSVTLNVNGANLTEGETTQLIATVNPSNATNKTVTWASGNTAVATVNSNGLVTAISSGMTTITAQAGGKTATCTVIVSEKVVVIAENPNIYQSFNKNWIRFVDGKNTLTFDKNCTVEFEYREIRKVGVLS